MRYINKQDILIIARNLGILMIGIGGMCLVPIIIDLIYLEFNAIYFIIPALISGVVGFILMKVLDKYNIDYIYPDTYTVPDMMELLFKTLNENEK